MDSSTRPLSVVSGQWCGERGVEVWGYCLMPNHADLIAVPRSEGRPATGDRPVPSALHAADQFPPEAAWLPVAGSVRFPCSTARLAKRNCKICAAMFARVTRQAAPRLSSAWRKSPVASSAPGNRADRPNYSNSQIRYVSAEFRKASLAMGRPYFPIKPSLRHWAKSSSALTLSPILM